MRSRGVFGGRCSAWLCGCLPDLCSLDPPCLCVSCWAPKGLFHFFLSQGLLVQNGARCYFLAHCGDSSRGSEMVRDARWRLQRSRRFYPCTPICMSGPCSAPCL